VNPVLPGAAVRPLHAVLPAERHDAWAVLLRDAPPQAAEGGFPEPPREPSRRRRGSGLGGLGGERAGEGHGLVERAGELGAAVDGPGEEERPRGEVGELQRRGGEGRGSVERGGVLRRRHAAGAAGGVVDRHGHGGVGGERGAGDRVAERGRVARGGGGAGGVAEGVAERVVQARPVVRGRRRRPRARARGEQPRRAAAHGIRRSGSVSGGGKQAMWSTRQATPSALSFFYQYAALPRRGGGGGGGGRRAGVRRARAL